MMWREILSTGGSPEPVSESASGLFHHVCRSSGGIISANPTMHRELYARLKRFLPKDESPFAGFQRERARSTWGWLESHGASVEDIEDIWQESLVLIYKLCDFSNGNRTIWSRDTGGGIRAYDMAAYHQKIVITKWLMLCRAKKCHDVIHLKIARSEATDVDGEQDRIDMSTMMASLPPDLRNIAELLLQGHRPKHIQSTLKLGRGTFNYRYGKLIRRCRSFFGL